MPCAPVDARNRSGLFWVRCLEPLICAVSKLFDSLPEKFDLSQGWMRAGVAGLAALTLATLLSVRPVRNMAYEFFLIAHIALIA